MHLHHASTLQSRALISRIIGIAIHTLTREFAVADHIITSSWGVAIPAASGRAHQS